MPLNPSPAVTPSSTAPSPERRRPWLRAVKALLLIAGLVYVAIALQRAITEVRSGQLELHVDAPWLIASGVLVLLAYLVLIEAWVMILTALAGRRLRFIPAARIWFISNLSVYIPAGPGWQILQMGVMSAEEGIGAVPAGAASIINAAINIACGLAVAAIAGAGTVAGVLGRNGWIGWTAAIVAAIGVLELPRILPVVFRIVHDRLRLAVPLVAPPARVILGAAAANMAAWALYGLALMCLSFGILGTATGSIEQYTAAFAAAYVFGYLLFVFPGGLGAREGSLVKMLVAAGVASGAGASLLAIGSRLLLIVIQVAPALLFLAYRRRPSDEKSAAG